MKKFEMVFIPAPGMGHLASTVEMANVLVTRDPSLSVTVLAMKLPYDLKVAECIDSLSMSFTGNSIQFIVLPEPSLPEESKKDFIVLVESYKAYVREAVANLVGSETSLDSPQRAGFVIDMFCTTMIDVANEFGVPCYVFYTCSASFLAFSVHLQELYDQNDSNEVVEQLLNSDTEFITLPNFANPIPSKLIPSLFSNKDKAIWFHNHIKRFRSEIKGILINTFMEMEFHAMESISSNGRVFPPLYFVGPILHLKNTGVAGSSEAENYEEILQWLDGKPPSSVILVCFGTMVSFDEDQVVEIANALEESGVGFIWSLRQPPPKGKFEAPRNYTDIKEVLPEGFLDRTADIGRVIGWTSQVELLAHPSIGGFVSHCGWNSIIESVWHGVPMATWPMHAEQQFNAFQMVKELGLAVEITLEYRITFGEGKPRLVSAEEIKNGIRTLMGEESNEIKKRVKEKSEESRKSVKEGGSSFISLGKFIDNVLANSPGGGN
ncbi:anthocyanidin 3-O-glucosyltransferase 2-like isoform X2 [Cucurbita pepo subsp. pepo]|uniref:anthocyanidin 3-O-glucosyltransferase 2-like isoform X1 n=1 Tax=Cucurbita pepo subsp. pepo TaxID=3664 RepID=UPI000C9D5704|nr:anthocyanidin 3-O-glucosyltransferase 2-like isoform X1 [Cucurbita pepo subsp. pepo]XP_023535914.1 anthocyanidin 3-O-glucosyltransferase 2-like isoform X2 [Cucurbita pepo subsp. pepo]